MAQGPKIHGKIVHPSTHLTLEVPVFSDFCVIPTLVAFNGEDLNDPSFRKYCQGVVDRSSRKRGDFGDQSPVYFLGCGVGLFRKEVLQHLQPHVRGAHTPGPQKLFQVFGEFDDPHLPVLCTF